MTVDFGLVGFCLCLTDWVQFGIGKIRIDHDFSVLWRIPSVSPLPLECLVVEHGHAVSDKVKLGRLRHPLCWSLDRPALLLDLLHILSYVFHIFDLVLVIVPRGCGLD